MKKPTFQHRYKNPQVFMIMVQDEDEGQKEATDAEMSETEGNQKDSGGD